ncbi:MAG: hypothetical protein IPM29_23395 [Planctomycetes bacterium]|nr:hypothetical protein [Planctomycetota bacterium]
MTRRTLVLAALLAVCASAPGQTLRATTGLVLIGEVMTVDADVVQMRLAWPEPGIRQISRSALTLASQYDALAVVTPNEAAARERLADECLRIGLPAQAMAELRRAASLSPEADSLGRLRERIRNVQDRIAKALFERARHAEAGGRLGAAQLDYMALVRDASDAELLLRADEGIKRLDARMQQQLAGTPRPRADLASMAIRAQRLQSRALDALGRNRDYRQALLLMAEAWDTVCDTAPDPARDPTFGETRDAVRRKLVELHLALGRDALAVGDVDGALWHAGNARELEPQRAAGADLHRAAVHVQLSTGFDLTSG